VSPCVRLAGALAAAALALAGCDKLFGPAASPFKGIDVTGSDIGGELRLTDHNGQARTLADFRGKVVAVFFGYTQCPDVCPTTMAVLADAMKQLGSASSGVQVLFVTVDPGRDTGELLKQYVTAFHPAFLGLRGDKAALTQVTRDFKVYWSPREGRVEESYTVDHSGQVFVLDQQGKVRLMLQPSMPAAQMASDLRVLLNNP
jgi:protein SCO1/2